MVSKNTKKRTVYKSTKSYIIPSRSKEPGHILNPGTQLGGHRSQTVGKDWVSYNKAKNVPDVIKSNLLKLHPFAEGFVSKRSDRGFIAVTAHVDVSGVKAKLKAIKANIAVFREDVAKDMGEYAVERVEKTAKKLMPSGGGSFLGTTTAEVIYENATVTGGETFLYVTSTHPWRSAIEYGTEPHDIKPKLGGLAGHIAKGYHANLTKKAYPEMEKDLRGSGSKPPKAPWYAPAQLQQIGYQPITRTKMKDRPYYELGSTTAHSSRYLIKENRVELNNQKWIGRVDPHVIATNKLERKYLDYKAARAMHGPQGFYTEKENPLERQYTITHETEHYLLYTEKDSRINYGYQVKAHHKEGHTNESNLFSPPVVSYNELFAVNAEQKFTRDIAKMSKSGELTGYLGRRMYSDGKTPVRGHYLVDEPNLRWTGAMLTFRDVVPGGSKNTPVESGVKYDKNKVRQTKLVKHPGARAFKIFHRALADTIKKRPEIIENHMKKLRDAAQKRAIK